MQNRILIIGKIPPPAGGLGIHVIRLVGSLKNDSIPVKLHDLRKDNSISLFSNIRQNDICHVHISNSYYRFVLVLIIKMLFRKSVFTFHGNLGRYGFLKNFIDQMSFVLSDKGVIINKLSYDKVWFKNKCELIAAFIPPIYIKPLSEEFQSDLILFRKNYDILCCTNANGLTYDKDGNEIYGIIDLVTLFSKTPKKGLIVSDASGAYVKHFDQNEIEIPTNVMLIEEQHDFVNVIKASDVFIRSTTTDGDSLSVKEALFYGKSTICSDCVDRPAGVILYETNNWDDLDKKINNVKGLKLNAIPQNGYLELAALYSKL